MPEHGMQGLDLFSAESECFPALNVYNGQNPVCQAP